MVEGAAIQGASSEAGGAGREGGGEGPGAE